MTTRRYRRRGVTARRYAGTPASTREDGATARRYGPRVLLLAVGSPKGGVGKTTCAVSLAALAARVLKLKVLVVDADENRSAVDWIGDDPDIDVAQGLDYEKLRQLRAGRGYDLAIIDLPGARSGAFEAVLTGRDGRPVVDLLLVPTLVEVMDLRPVIRTVEREVLPLRLATMVVLTRVPFEHLPRAQQRKAELRARGLTVADTIVRRYVAYDEAVEASQTVLDIPGRHHRARRAEADMRQLAVEVFGRLGLDVRALAPGEF